MRIGKGAFFVFTIAVLSAIIMAWSFGAMKRQHQATEQRCLRIGLPQIYTFYDPSKLETTPQVFMINALGGTLVRVGDDNQYYAGIAESWRISEDGREYEFTIASQAKFSNGEPILARDVIATIKRAILIQATHSNIGSKIEGAEALSSMDIDVSGLREVSSRVVAIRTKNREANFLALMSFPELIILPYAEALQKLGDITFRVSSGAYAIEKHLENDIVLKANPYFYEEFGSAAGCLQVMPFPKVEAAVDALEKGHVDLLDYGAVLEPRFGELLRNEERFTFTNGFSNAIVYIILNPSRSLFAERENRVRILKSLSGSHALIPYGEGTIFYPTRQFLPETQAGYLLPDQIKAIYESLPRTSGSTQSRQSAVILYPEVFGAAYMEKLRKEIDERGELKANFLTYEEGNLVAALQKNDFDALFMIVGMGEKDTEILMGYHFGRRVPLYNFEDTVIKEHLDAAKMTTDKKAKIGHYQAISEQLIREAYVVPISHFSWPIIHSAKIYYQRTNRFQMINNIWRVSWR